MNTSWQADLLTAAVLGTGRRPPPTVPAELGAAPAGLPPEVLLLDQLAVGAALARAGRTARTGEPIAPAAPEVRPAAPERAAAQLRMLIETPPSRELRTELLRRWLACAEESGVVVPPEFLPILAALAVTEPELRAPLAAVRGRRGDWLAARATAQKRGAGTGTAAPAPAASPTGGEPTLADLRADDPAAGLDRLRAAWPSLPARAKEEALKTLRTGLSAADEEFLESCLTERSSRVTAAARTLLTLLPDSRFARRMADRLRPLLTVTAPGRFAALRPGAVRGSRSPRRRRSTTPPAATASGRSRPTPTGCPRCRRSSPRRPCGPGPTPRGPPRPSWSRRSPTTPRSPRPSCGPPSPSGIRSGPPRSPRTRGRRI
ncbi:MAG: DUF5691 domain-containing protein [Gordonia sp. (in: high G+C Gram-positive bacteria)]